MTPLTRTLRDIFEHPARDGAEIPTLKAALNDAGYRAPAPTGYMGSDTMEALDDLASRCNDADTRAVAARIAVAIRTGRFPPP